MAGLLGDLDGQATVAKKIETPRPRAAPTRISKTSLSGFKRKAEEPSEISPFRSNGSNGNAFASSSDVASDPLSDPAFGLAPSSDGYENGTKKARFDASIDENRDGMRDISFEDGPSEVKSGGEDVKMESQEDDDDDDLFVKPSAPTAKPKGGIAQRRQLVNASSAKPKLPKSEILDQAIPSPSSSGSSIEMKPKPKGLDWRTATSNLATLASHSSTSNENELNLDEQANFNAQHQTVVGKNASKALATVTNALEPDGNLQFWWFDYDEPASQPGTVRLIGKVRARGESVRVFSDGEKVVPKYVSAVLTVKGIKRKLYVLPKTKAECGYFLLSSAPPL
jgi:DNA polymerase alpha subunit A